ncbi:leucine-rich repeat domain-containing protein [Candidatus Lokiarchaeum ossiferum]|uniref:leucine-rich repeat domain-containing protein n=1 Tax=Candidatus Lokiarchaeum ossiferum TaxID=2951803 RepID=UPI00352C84DE
MFFNPKLKLKLIKDVNERRSIQSIMNILDNSFGFNYSVSNGHVIEIQLISVGLALIPRQFGNFPHLNKIQVPSNRIKKLRNIERCQNATIINLSGNQLKSSALEQMISLTKLISLNLSENQLESYYELGLLKNLEFLDLSYNNITKIPDCAFSHLKSLNLSNNPIFELENLHRYESLVQIRMDNCNLPTKEIDILEEGIEAIKDYCRDKALN